MNNHIECPNCEEKTTRLIEPALLRLPIDMSDRYEGESVYWKEPGGFSDTEFIVVIRNDEPLVHVSDAKTEPLCPRCFNHGIWPKLYPFIANRPPEIKLDGWSVAVWQEVEGEGRRNDRQSITNY